MTETPKPESYDDIKGRLEALQTPLAQLVDLGLHVHRTFRPTAPHLHDAPSDAPVHYIASMNRYAGFPVSDTLTFRFDNDEHVSIEQYNGPSLTQPVLRIDHWFTYDETRLQRTRIQLFQKKSGATFPLDVEVSLYADGGRRHDEFLGYGYVDQEPHISRLEDRLLSLVLPDTSV